MITKLIDFIKENNSNMAIDWNLLDDLYSAISDYYTLQEKGYNIKNLGKRYDIDDLNIAIGDGTYTESELYELDTIIKTLTNGSGQSIQDIYHDINTFHLLADEGHNLTLNISQDNLNTINYELKINKLNQFEDITEYNDTINNVIKLINMYKTLK